MKIALLCPTRERVNDQKRLIDSLKSTTNNLNNICLYFGVDEDDPCMKETASYECDWIKVVKIPNGGTFLGLGKIWNLMAKEVSEDIFMMTGDDMVFETKDWELEILKEFEGAPDKILMIHCNDGMRGSGNPFAYMHPLAVASFIHRIYYDTFGYYTREEWKHGYHDNWIQDVFAELRRAKYRHDIMIRHLHYSNPAANVKADKVSDQLSAAFTSVDGKGLYREMANQRQEEVNKLRGLFHVKISIITPTRSRPHNLKRMFDSLIATVADPANVEVSIRIDDDDLDSKNVLDEYKDKNFNCRYVMGPRNSERLNPLWNDAWQNATGEIFMMAGDDFIFRTPGWDTVIREEFNKYPDKIVFIFGEDGIQHERLGTHGFVHKNWTDTLGYFVQPYCMIYYFDTWNDHIAKHIGRRIFLSQLFFEHAHHSVSKSEHDALYVEMETKGGRDDQIWRDTVSIRRTEAEKLSIFIQSHRGQQ